MDLHDLHYYVFRFKAKMLGEWMLGVCGGYEGDELDHCGHVFSQMEKYNDRTAIEDAAPSLNPSGLLDGAGQTAGRV